jgi:hypothetical protein
MRLAAREFGRLDALGDFQLARLDIRQPHDGIGHDHILHFVEMGVGRVPVFVEAFHHDPFLRDALDEAVRAGADRMVGEIGGLGCCCRLRRYDHAGTVRQLCQQRGKGFRQIEAHGVGIDHIDAGNRRELRLPLGFSQRFRAFDVELHRGSIDLLAVMEHCVLTQHHGQRFLVRGQSPTRCQERHDLSTR